MSQFEPKISDLFARKPDTWGLPGDESLWGDLMSSFESTDLPTTPFVLLEAIYSRIEELTGVDLYSPAEKDAVFIERYSQTSQDKLQATISMTWWNDEGVKLLLQRYLDDFLADGYVESIGL